jgi:hypothetical protein
MSITYQLIGSRARGFATEPAVCEYSSCSLRPKVNMPFLTGFRPTHLNSQAGEKALERLGIRVGSVIEYSQFNPTKGPAEEDGW